MYLRNPAITSKVWLRVSFYAEYKWFVLSIVVFAVLNKTDCLIIYQ